MQTILELIKKDTPFALGYFTSKAYLESGKTLRYPECPYQHNTVERRRWIRGFFTFDNEYHDES